MVDLRKADCLRVVQCKSFSGDRLDDAVLSCELIHVSLIVQVFAIEVEGGCLTVVQDWWSHRELRVALIVLVGLVQSLSLLFGTTSSSLPTSSTTLLRLQRSRTEIWRVLAARANLLLLLDHDY